MRPAARVALAQVLALLMTLALAAAPATASMPRPVGGAFRAPPRGAARAPVTLPHSGAHGVVYRRGSLQARLLKADCSSSCVSPLFYWGGPVMSTPKAYAIYWNPSGAGTSFPTGYETTIDSFLQNVASAGATSPLGNVFSVDLLYGDTSVAGRYGWTYGGAYVDTASLPARNTSECPVASAEEAEAEQEGEPGLPPAGEPCVTDAQLRQQLKQVVSAKGLPTGLGALYFVMTPETVNSCAGGEGAEAECSTNTYCAYHYNTESPRLIYANMPYADRPGCEIPDQPQASRASAPPGESPADDELDVISHEGNEAITDPLGGQEGEGTAAWISYAGNEVGDLCTYPFFASGIDFNETLDAFGALLGGTMASFSEATGELEALGTAYNQEIDGGHYLLQREWSNAANGCVARAPVPAAAFATYSSPGTAGEPVSFDAAASSASAGSITGYRWEFGDGASASGEAHLTHTYAAPGTYTVKLTVSNNSGASASTTHQVTIQAPKPPVTSTVTKTTSAPPTLITTSVTTTRTVSAPAPEPPIAHYSSAGLARLLGLPPNGRRLSGLGRIHLGHAQCPPACGVDAKMVAIVRSGPRHGRHVRRITIGRLKKTIASKATGTLALRLSGRGRRLLRRMHTLHVRLILTVQDRQGASWRIVRRLTLSSSAKAARHHRGRGHAARRHHRHRRRHAARRRRARRRR